MNEIKQRLNTAARHHQSGRYHEAEKIYRQILSIAPDTADAWHLLGMIAHQADQNEAAIQHIRRAMDLTPNNAVYIGNLGTVYEDQRQWDDAIACLREAIRLQPKYAIAHNNLGEVHKALGQIPEALACYRKSLESDPGFLACRSNYLMTLNYDPDATVETIFAEHRRWGASLQPNPPNLESYTNVPDPNRPLRIGYVSPDIRKHAVARFLEPILANHDRSAVDVYLYAEVPRDDATTARFRSLAQGFFRTAGRSVDQVADQIRADRIDILIDLAGHTRHNRLDVFARAPAPVQATYLGYSNTTGLEPIQYRISDDVLDPPGRSSLTTETIVHLPGSFACFAPPPEAPDVVAPPVKTTSCITFGSHHPPIKLNDRVLALWARVLAATPESRLLLMRDSFEPGMANRLLLRLQKNGIDPARVIMRCPTIDESSYLALFAEIDVILDSFPFSGHTMTCEALWMGVPVVTLYGDRPTSRLSSSVLRCLGLEELIAESPDEYVSIATRLAADFARLSALRRGMRERMQAELCNGAQFTIRLEAAYRKMWQTWCDSHSRLPSERVATSSVPERMEKADLPVPSKLPNDSAAALNEEGIAHARRGSSEEARKCFEQALRIRPDHAGAHNNLGNIYKRLGQLPEADHAFLKAIALDPSDVTCHLNLAQLRREQGRLTEALAGYRNAVRLAPDRMEAHCGLAGTLADLGRPEESISSYRAALALTPENATVHTELGNLFQQISDFKQAETSYRRVIDITPSHAEAHANLACLLYDQGKSDEGQRHFDIACRERPSARLRVAADTTLPPCYSSLGHLQSVRSRLIGNLRRLEDDGVRIDPMREIMPNLFYLAYQGQNDREIHECMARLGSGSSDSVRPLPRPNRGDKIRVGFISRFLKDHTIGRLNQGIIAKLSRDQFEVVVLSVGPADDRLGSQIRGSADRYVIVPLQLAAAARTVTEQNLDILFYPDIGMDPFTYTLAFSRLAPVQCVTWGHPVTTGLPTMDYFISSEDLESPGSDDQYSEQLVRLPRLGVYYERPTLPAPALGRDAFGLPAAAHLYACPQTLFKFHPDFDMVLCNILRSDTEGLLILIEGKYPSWTQSLKNRFKESMPDVHDRIRWLPSQSRQNYLHLLANADVLLDPLHFGGGNSSYEGLALGTPIVTLPSTMLRGRLTYAMYQQMDLQDLIVADTDEYVQLSVRLGTNVELRRSMHERILARCHVLFDDLAAVRHLEEFFNGAIGRGR